MVNYRFARREKSSINVVNHRTSQNPDIRLEEGIRSPKVTDTRLTRLPEQSPRRVNVSHSYLVLRVELIRSEAVSWSVG